VKTYERSTTSSSITGETTQVETGSDDYSMTQTGVDGLRVYTQYLSGEDTYTITATSNDTADGLDKTITGSGTYSSLNEGTDDGVPFLETVVNGSTTFGLEETGTYVDGNLAITQTGADRYDLLQQFNNPSTAVNGMAGTVDFSPVGAMVTVGIGVPPPTGGAGYGNGRVTVEGVASLLMGGYGSQSHANLRGSEATGLMGLSDGWAASGAEGAAAFAAAGHQLAVAYCFAAGTKVLMADGSFKAIETIQAGERVMAVDEHKPEGRVVESVVVEPYHNAPSDIQELRVRPTGEFLAESVSGALGSAEADGGGGSTGSAAVAVLEPSSPEGLIRTTPNHPFYVRGRGWVKAKNIHVGDRLRGVDGGDVEVVESVGTAAIEPVYNLHVAKAHTYFVVLPGSRQAVLVHNESYYAAADEAINDANEALSKLQELQSDPNASAEDIKLLLGRFKGLYLRAQGMVNDYENHGWGWGDTSINDRFRAIPTDVASGDARFFRAAGAGDAAFAEANSDNAGWYGYGMGLVKTGAAIGVGAAVVATLPAIAATVMVSAAASTAFGLNFALRLDDGQDTATAAKGGLFDITGITTGGALATGYDLATTTPMTVSSEEKGAFTAGAIGTVIGVGSSIWKGVTQSLARAAQKNADVPMNLAFCFAPDTLIDTPTGQRRIDSIVEGEEVLAFDFERGQWRPNAVLTCHRSRYLGAVVSIETETGLVEATAYHPFWVLEGHDLENRPRPKELTQDEDEGLSIQGRWVNSHDLFAGDLLVSVGGRPLRVLRTSQRYETSFSVCNLTVRDHHSFAVGRDRLLVHNTNGCAQYGGAATRAVKQGGKITEPNLPAKTIVKEGDVEIVHFTRSGDHGPPHLHVRGGGPETKIGQAGKPIKGSPELTATQARVVESSKSLIRKAVAQIGRWYRFNNAE
jgi:hypothetical protein